MREKHKKTSLRQTVGYSYIPRAIRESYLLFLGFWISFLLAAVLHNSTSPILETYSYIILGILLVFFAISFSSLFDDRGAGTGSLPSYGFALLIWILTGYILYQTSRNLVFAKPLHFTYYFLCSFIYICRIISVEIIRQFKASL